MSRCLCPWPDRKGGIDVHISTCPNREVRKEYEAWATRAFSDYPGPDPEDDGLPCFEYKPNGHYKYPGVDAGWVTWLAKTEAAVEACVDMAERYDTDIEGCDGDELLQYGEGITCSFRLAYIIKYGKFPPKGDAWSVEFAELFQEIRKKVHK